jgi:glycosyltransferase involved in cell wall biosynthesis
VPTDRGALGRYVDGLIGALGSAGADLVVVSQRADVVRYGALVPGAHVVPGPFALGHRSARLAWEQSGLPVVAAEAGASVIHMPHYSMPMHPGLPTVVTIHDVTYFTDPSLHPPATAMFFKSAIRTAVRRATRLIVPSVATRSELERVLDVDPARVDVAYHGVDVRVFRRPSPAEVSMVSNRLGLHGRPYIAYLGSLDPRKNVAALISGWVAAVGDLSDPPALVLAGGGGWSAEADAAVAAVPAHLRLCQPGYLSYSDLPGFFGGALVAAFPSRGEGFGLPVLEAMACGAAVLTTRCTSLPEVGGDAVAYTDPSAEAIGSSLRELLGDQARRDALGVAGHTRAQQFTWAASAAAHMDSYKRAVDQGGGL